MTGIYEKLLCKWLLSLHWLMHWPSESQDHSGTVDLFALIDFWHTQWKTVTQKFKVPAHHVIRPIVHWRQSFCWTRSWFQSSCIFPKHQKAPLRQYCYLQYHTVWPTGLEGRKEKKTLAIGVCTKRNHPSSRRSKWFNTQLITQLFHSCLWFFHCVSMPHSLLHGTQTNKWPKTTILPISQLKHFCQ